MSPQLLHLTRELATLSWRDRLVLLGYILRSLLINSGKGTESRSQESSSLAEELRTLQSICEAEDYALEIPARENRVSPFGD